MKPPRHALNILGVGRSDVPEPTSEWLEELMTGVLYAHAGHFSDYDDVLDAVRKDFKRIGAIERRKVVIDNTKEIKKTPCQ